MRITTPTKSSLYFYFDQSTAREALAAFQAHGGVLAVEHDEHQRLEFSLASEDSIVFTPDGISLLMEADSFDYAVWKLEEFLSYGMFSTPEFREFGLPGSAPPPKHRCVNSYFMDAASLTPAS